MVLVLEVVRGKKVLGTKASSRLAKNLELLSSTPHNTKVSFLQAETVDLHPPARCWRTGLAPYLTQTIRVAPQPVRAQRDILPHPLAGVLLHPRLPPSGACLSIAWARPLPMIGARQINSQASSVAE